MRPRSRPVPSEPPGTRLIEAWGDSRCLGEDERIHIADRLREKATIRAIATELGRNPSTVRREIRRNRHPVNDQYRPHGRALPGTGATAPRQGRKDRGASAAA